MTDFEDQGNDDPKPEPYDGFMIFLGCAALGAFWWKFGPLLWSWIRSLGRVVGGCQ
jgi:hypothetical protein